MEMMVSEQRKDMHPVTIGMMSPAFAKTNEESLNVSEDIVQLLLLATGITQKLGMRYMFLISILIIIIGDFGVAFG